MNSMPAPAQAATLSTLHRFLASGLVLVGAVFAVMTFLGRVPFRPPDSSTDFVAEISGGVQLVMLAVAWVVLKPQIPARTAGQSAEAWATPPTTAKVLRVWFLCDGAGILGAVAFGLTGSMIPAAVGVLALLGLLMLAPSRLAGE
jgi:hypothetical protein